LRQGKVDSAALASVVKFMETLIDSQHTILEQDYDAERTAFRNYELKVRQAQRRRTVTGAIDTVLGVGTLLSAVSLGLGTVAVGALYVVGYSIKACVRMARGAQQEKGAEKPVAQRLEKNIAELQGKIKGGEALNSKDRAMLVGLKAVKLIDSDTTIPTDSSKPFEIDQDSALAKSILDIGHEDVENKFTGQTIRIHLNGTAWENTKSFVVGLAS
jgi:hypothetical protein